MLQESRRGVLAFEMLLKCCLSEIKGAHSRFSVGHRKLWRVNMCCGANFCCVVYVYVLSYTETCKPGSRLGGSLWDRIVAVISEENVLPTMRIGVVANLNDPVLYVYVYAVISEECNRPTFRFGVWFLDVLLLCVGLSSLIDSCLLINDVLLGWCFCWEWKLPAVMQFWDFFVVWDFVG